MRKAVYSVALLAIMGISGYSGIKTLSLDTGGNSIELANVEALARDEGNSSSPMSGDPCYSDGKYNGDYPETVVCDKPCKVKPWKPDFWGSISYCP